MCHCEEGWSGQHCRECSIKYCDRCSGIPPICQQCSDGYVIAMTGKSQTRKGANVNVNINLQLLRLNLNEHPLMRLSFLFNDY